MSISSIKTMEPVFSLCVTLRGRYHWVCNGILYPNPRGRYHCLSCTRPIWRCPKMVRTGTFWGHVRDMSGTRPGHIRPGTYFWASLVKDIGQVWEIEKVHRTDWLRTFLEMSQNGQDRDILRTRPGHAQIFHYILGIQAIELSKMNWVHNS